MGITQMSVECCNCETVKQPLSIMMDTLFWPNMDLSVNCAILGTNAITLFSALILLTGNLQYIVYLSFAAAILSQ